MKRTVFDCDRCGKQIPAELVTVISRHVDCHLDPAGDTDYDDESVDLCPKCVGVCLGEIIFANVPACQYVTNKAVMQFLRTRGTRAPKFGGEQK